LLGGAIAWDVNKRKDSKKAKWMLIFGLIATIIGFITLWITLSFYFKKWYLSGLTTIIIGEVITIILFILCFLFSRKS
jgi:apolipoprotein N-acyltransferase